jgi:hypothetical protein
MYFRGKDIPVLNSAPRHEDVWGNKVHHAHPWHKMEVRHRLNAPAALPPGEEVPGMHGIRVRVGPRYILYVMVKRKSFPMPGIELWFPCHSPSSLTLCWLSYHRSCTDTHYSCDFINADSSAVTDMLIRLILNLETHVSFDGYPEFAPSFEFVSVHLWTFLYLSGIRPCLFAYPQI